MLGWIVADEGKKLRIYDCQAAGVVFRKLEGPVPRTRWQRWRWRRWLGKLRRYGVMQAAVRGPVPEDLMAVWGLRAVDPAPLRLLLLPQLITYVQREWGLPLQRRQTLLRSPDAGAQVRQAAEILVRQVRYLELEVPFQQELEELLRCRYGLAPGGGGTPALQVCLGTSALPGVPALHLGRDCRQRQKLELEYPEEPEADEQLLAAILWAGKLKVEEIRVKTLQFSA